MLETTLRTPQAAARALAAAPSRRAAPQAGHPAQTKCPPLGAAAGVGWPVIPFEAACHALGTYPSAFRYRWFRKGGIDVAASGRHRPLLITRGELRRLFLADMLETAGIFERLDRAYQEANRLLAALHETAHTAPLSPAETSYPVMRAGKVAGAFTLDLVGVARIADDAFRAAAPHACPAR